MNEQQQWYVTIAGNAVGPVSTDLVLRGIKHKKIATEAYVCVVGAQEWQALADVPEFHGALKEHGLLPELSSAQSPQTDGGPMSLAAIAAAQAAAARATAVANTDHETLSDAVADDESELTAPFSSRGIDNLEKAHLEAAALATPAHDEQSEITKVASLFPTQPEADSVEETTAQFPWRPAPRLEAPAAPLPSRPAPRVAIFEAASATDDAPEATHEADRSNESLPYEPRNGKRVEVAFLSHPPMPSIDIEVDIGTEDHEPATPEINWNHGFADYFLIDANVTLPDDQLLLRSLTNTPHETFLHDEAMWNLALCLAFGSNAVASVAADVFFDVITNHRQYERIEWVTRTLLSRGFMPSGIPHANGNQAIGRLRLSCPEELRMQLEAQIGI